MQRLLLFFTMLLATVVAKAQDYNWSDGTNTITVKVEGDAMKIEASNAGAIAAFFAATDADAVAAQNALYNTNNPTTLKVEAGGPGHPGTLYAADFTALNSTTYTGLARFTKFELMGETAMSPANALSNMRLEKVKEINVKGAEVKAGTYTWDIFQNAGSKTENVATIDIKEPGALTAALAAFAAIDAAAVDCQVLHISGLDNAHQGSVLTDEDRAALGNVNVETLDLQDLTTGSTGYSFVNNYVKRVILPDGWTKAQVNAFGAAQTSSNFECCLSQWTNVGVAADGSFVAGNNSALNAYVKKCGTLFECIDHITYNGYNNGENASKMGTINQSTFAMSKLKYVSISGYPSARDLVNGKQYFYTPDGHYKANVEADETKINENSGVGGVTRTNVGDYQLVGALQGVDALRMDLSDAIISEQWNTDLTLSWTGTLEHVREVLIPTSSEVKTLPADFLAGSFPNLRELCIPGNIEFIRTRACATSNRKLDHIWTTGDNPKVKYDNGAYLVNSDESETMHEGHLGADVDNANAFTYGTITLPPNLKVIESNAFCTSDHIKDVYSLNVTAPECHVDAFSTVMYNGNNTVGQEQSLYSEGMITREAYTNSKTDRKYTAILHYPRECGTPDIQRYTDPTREYSVATTMRDGKGNIIYFPNMGEFQRAYAQGTTGYVWYAWDSQRAAYTNGFVSNPPHNYLTSGHTTTVQQYANDQYISNTSTKVDKTDRAFYDVRLDADDQPTLEKPAGLKAYYETKWEDTKLYPQRQTTEGAVIMNNGQPLQHQAQDVNGHLLYDQCDDGNFVQEYNYVEDTNGPLVWDVVATESEYGSKVRDYNYAENANGGYYHPMIVETNKDDNNPTQYYYPVTSYKPDENGGYIDQHEFDSQSANYITIETAQSWSIDVTNYTKYKQENSWVHIQGVGNEYYQNTLYKVSTEFAPWSEDVTDYITGANETRYAKSYYYRFRDYNGSTDEGETRYDVTSDNGVKTYVEGQFDGKTRLRQEYVEYEYRRFNDTYDRSDEQRWCPTMLDVHYQTVDISNGNAANDYRGWHQFVLTAYATNSTEPFTPVKFYQNDNDWWTVCLPYDLKYNDMKRFFGKETGEIPYLSKLMYVVRDYDLEQITMMFSNNLMIYKEDISGDNVHGDITNTKYTADELAANPVILHKGVPYLIRPNIDTSKSRSFDVYLSQTDDLYERLIDAQNVGGGALETYIYKGEYTVPAYVVGTSIPETTVASKTLQMWGTP